VSNYGGRNSEVTVRKEDFQIIEWGKIFKVPRNSGTNYFDKCPPIAIN